MERYVYKRVEDDFIEKLKERLRRSEERIEELLKIEKKTYDNFFNEMEIMKEEISRENHPIINENSTYITDIGRELHKKYIPIMSEYRSRISQNEDVARALRVIYETEDLTPVRKRILKKRLGGLKSSGIGIEEEKKERLKEIKLEISRLASEYSKNVTDAINDYEMIIEDEEIIREMPETARARAAVGEGRWRFTLHKPSYTLFMTYCTDRKKREELYKAYVTRAPKNEEVAVKLLKLRREKARILGYESYRDLSIKGKTADSGDEVIEFLNELAKAALPKAKKEVEELMEVAEELGYEGVEYYDTDFLGRRVKERKYIFDPREVRPYLEKERVLKGMLDFLEDLFDMEFLKREDAELWSEKASAYEVKRNGRTLGLLILDLETNDSKKSGAWASSCQKRYLRPDGRREYGVVKVSCNFPRSIGDEVPSLLSPKNVITLFHEMGHALHSITSEVDEVSASGLAGAERDVIEYPSQWLQEFANNKEVLRRFAKHYETGEPMEEELLERMVKSRRFGRGMAVCRQIEFALFDMLIHDDVETPEEMQEVLDRVRERVNPLNTPRYNKFQNHFRHIFARKYAAGYYSYKWAEVLSADSYSEMTKDGSIDKALANEFYEKLLSRGGSKNMRESFVEVHGRKPKGEALLKLLGIL